MSESENAPVSGGQPWDGVERRKNRGRPVLTRGPIIISLEILSGLTGIAAIAALIFALLSFSERLDTIQEARQASAFDSCRIIDAILEQSGRQSVQRATVYDLHGRIIGYVQFGGKGQAQKVETFISKAGLKDCHQYAIRVRQGKPNATPTKVPMP